MEEIASMAEVKSNAQQLQQEFDNLTVAHSQLKEKYDASLLAQKPILGDNNKANIQKEEAKDGKISKKKKIQGKGRDDD